MYRRDEHGRLSGRRFFRDKSRAWLGGVCAGIADYFGFSLGATRLLTVIGAIAFAPMTFLIYIALWILVPARKRPQTYYDEPEERAFRKAVRSRPKRTLSDVHRRFQQLDARLANLERHVTSSRYRLDREFDRL
ncbi:MAG: envelope stress response membrane protein PspC [Pseudomonadota bacterium]